MNPILNQSELSTQQSRSNALTIEAFDENVATASLAPPPFSIFAHNKPKVDVEKTIIEKQSENINTNDDFSHNDPIQTSLDQKQPEVEEEKIEPFSLDLEFDSAPSENPIDDAPSQPEGNGDNSSKSQIPFQLQHDSLPFPDNQAYSNSSTTNTYGLNLPNFNADQNFDFNNIISDMENSFGQSFNDVQIRENSPKAEKMGARAFAQDSEIHFATGQYNPNSFEGRSLIGHELTHVVQQREGRVEPNNSIQGFAINDDPLLEQEAEEMGRKAAGGELLPLNINNSGRKVSQSIQRSVAQCDLEGDELSEIVTALKNTENQENAVRLLQSHHSDLDTIKSAFLESTNGQVSLRQFIQRYYYQIDYKIRATSLLFDSTYDHDWTQIALSLIPFTTADVRFFSIMGRLTNSQKSDLRRKYDARFAMIGHGSLEEDIRSDFDGVDELRAWIISYRSLTDADNIYLLTQHITSSNASEIVAILRRIWGYGVNFFDQKLRQWNPTGNLPDVATNYGAYRSIFENEPNNFATIFPQINNKAKSLILTVLQESYSESAEQIFLEYINRITENSTSEDQEPTGWGFTAEEQSNLEIARTRLTSAEHWYNDEEDEINAASEEIVEIYRGRVERLTQANASEEYITNAETALHDVQGRLVSQHDASIASVREQNLADQVYNVRHSQTTYSDKIIEIFKLGKLEKLKTEARVASSFNGNVVRPAFDLQGPIISSTMRGGRMQSFLTKTTQESAGSYWIKDAIDREYVQPPTLAYIQSFINGGTWRGSIKLQVLSYFNQHHVSRTFLNSYNGDQKKIFLRHLAHIGFDTFPLWRTFRDTLSPPTSNSQRLIRAEIDMEQENSSPAGNLANAVSDMVTGEDTRDMAETSLRRLRIFANQAGASDEEMSVFIAFYGEDTDLGTIEYQTFQSSLGHMRTAKNQVASLASSVVSTVIEAALSPFITPMGGAIVGQVCGILTEWIINPYYEPISSDNLGAIVIGAATAGASSWTDEAGAITRWVNNRTTNRYLRVAATGAIEQTINATASGFSARLEGRLDEDWIRSEILGALSSQIADGLVSMTDIQRIQDRVIRDAFRDMAERTTAEVISTSTSLVFGEGEDEEQLANRIGRQVLSAIVSTTIEGIGERLQQNRQNNRIDHDSTDVDLDRSSGERTANVPPAPGLDLDRSSGERSAIAPPPIHGIDSPTQDSPNRESSTAENDNRPTIYDLPSTNTIPAPENINHADVGNSDTSPATPNSPNQSDEAGVNEQSVFSPSGPTINERARETGSAAEETTRSSNTDTRSNTLDQLTLPMEDSGSFEEDSESDIWQDNTIHDLPEETVVEPHRTTEVELPAFDDDTSVDSERTIETPIAANDPTLPLGLDDITIPIEGDSDTSEFNDDDDTIPNTTVEDTEITEVRTPDFSDETEVNLNLPDNIVGATVHLAGQDHRLEMSANIELFNDIATTYPRHECSLIRNIETGEYAVVHGEERSVVAPPGYIYVEHSHPVGENGYTTNLDCNPSVQDLELVLHQQRSYGVSDHRVRVVTENGVDRMNIVATEDQAFRIDTVDNEGVMERGQYFENIAAYAEWLEQIHLSG